MVACSTQPFLNFPLRQFWRNSRMLSRSRPACLSVLVTQPLLPLHTHFLEVSRTSLQLLLRLDINLSKLQHSLRLRRMLQLVVVVLLLVQLLLLLQLKRRSQRKMSQRMLIWVVSSATTMMTTDQNDRW